MSHPSRPPRWPMYPGIPNYLKAKDGRSKTQAGGPVIRYLPPIDQTFEIRNCSQQSINQLPTQPRSRLSNQSPEIRGFPTKPPKAQRPRFPVKAHPASHTSSRIIGESDRSLSGTLEAGLGIIGTPQHVPSTMIQSQTNKKNESTPNIATRIEKRLWKFSHSGNIIEQWLVELISWTVSALCMSAIIGVLIFLKDESPPDWKGLTLNTYIAVVSKVASAALMLPVSEALGQLKWSWFRGEAKKMWDFEIFDNASRGPWGSFLLLIRTKCKTLAALGAAVVILSLALDPFFQQIVSLPERWQTAGNSSIPRVIHYDSHAATVFSGGVPAARVDQDLQAVAEKFFYENGTQPIVFGNGTRAEVPLSCPTSNCTWAPYESLGVCSSCASVSQYLEYGCMTTRVDWFDNLSGYIGMESTYPNRSVCGYFLNASSEAPVLMSGYSIDPDTSSPGEALLLRTMPLITNPLRQPVFGGSINFKDIRNPIGDFLIVAAPGGAASVYRNETPVASECVMYWCVKTFKSSYYWAKYQEDVTHISKNTTGGPYPWLAYVDNGTIHNEYHQNITITPDAPSTGELDIYGVSNDTALKMAVIFDEMFPSYSTVANSSTYPLLRFGVVSKGPPQTRRYDNDFNPWVFPNVSSHVDRLATALTNVVRSSAGNYEMKFGDAWSMEAFVKVHWAWLSFPLSLLILSFVFLVATVIKSSQEKSQVGVWKTSAIATLLYGIPDAMRKKIAASMSVGTPRAKAKDLRVKLLPDKHGWRVSGNLFSPMRPKLRQNHPPPGWI